MLENVFQKGKIGTMELENRFVVPPMVTMYTNEDGTTTEKFIKYYEEKAKGGFGLIITENYSIMPGAGGFKKMGCMWNDEHMEDHKKLVERIHQYDSKIALQIYHAGRETTSEIIGMQPVGPSAIADPTMPEVPRELTKEDINEIIEAFGQAALRGKKAGFDAVEIHGAHGYLINQFLSPFSNKRTDEYGGNLVNRFRFAREVIANVREKVGKDYPLLFRISAEELVEGGLTIEDTKIIAQFAEEAGIDAIDMSVGVYTTRYMIAAPAAKNQGWMQDYAKQLKSVVNIPVIVVNRITDPFMADSIVKSGAADFVAMGRASIADPHLPNKAKEGRYEDIRKCIGCMQGCIGRQVQGLDVSCLVNPEVGKEEEFKIETAQQKRKVFIAGGGPAGMEAAIVSARRGHEVHLYEKKEKLGGQWLFAAIPPNKEELNTLTIWQTNQLNKLGVSVHLNTELTKEIIDSEKPDTLIVATGATPVIPGIPGIDKEHVVTAEDILMGKVNAGKKAVVIGGGLVGAETAEHLAVHWKDVTIVEMLPEIVPNLEEGPRVFLMKSLEETKTNILTNTKVLRIEDEYVLVEKDGKEFKVEADTVVVAIGSRSVNNLKDEIKDSVEKVITVGDSLKVSRALEAMKAAYEAGLEA